MPESSKEIPSLSPSPPPAGLTDANGAALPRPRVLYVMGAGRSGSTIFGVTLGNCDGLFYAGELDAWLGRSGVPLVEDGERVRFWEQVRGGVEGAAQLFGRQAERSLERSVSVFRVHKWPTRRRLRGPYRVVAGRLYRSVARTSGSPVIVDTSHYPLRARELQALEDIELFIVYLVRDPQSVVGSFNRTDVQQYNKSTLTTNVYLWLTHLLALRTFLRQPRERRLFVSYEDFIADPARVVQAILDLLGSDAALPEFSALDVGLAFQGNRLIRSSTIALKAGSERVGQTSRITTAMQFPWGLLLRRLRPRAPR